MITDRSYTIVPIPGMEVIQKNFAKLLKDGDSVAERYAEKGKVWETLFFCYHFNSLFLDSTNGPISFARTRLLHQNERRSPQDNV